VISGPHPQYPLVSWSAVCIECRRPWLDASERWRVYLTDDDPPVPVTYCAACAEREFD
jgi:hypothetical protein